MLIAEMWLVSMMNRRSKYPWQQGIFLLGVFLTTWYGVNKYDLYQLKQDTISLLIALLMTGVFLIILLFEDRFRRLRYEKTNHSRLFDIGYLRKLIFYDHLTGLPNRKYFLLRLGSALNHAKQYQTSFSLCFIDCDHFKQVNDRYGHYIGDCLLKHIGSTVSEKIRGNDFFARFSGDEFCLILDGCVTEASIHAALTKILRAISHPITIDTHTINTTVSIGVVVCEYAALSLSPEELLIQADRAMYLAKQKKGSYLIMDISPARHHENGIAV